MSHTAENMKKNWVDAITFCNENNQAWVLATIIGTRGSTPRESSTKMLVTDSHTYDTLGGGRLEKLVTEKARELIKSNKNQQQIENYALSLKAHQCCGGSVTILFECFAKTALNVHLFGAGHVAKSLVKILGELDVRVHWVDSRVEQFPQNVPNNVKLHHVIDVTGYTEKCRTGDYALILTHDHALDYSIVERLLTRKVCGFIGLIGSKSKAVRFKRLLKEANISTHEINSLHCPVGLDSVIGKKPMKVAVSIAAQLIEYQNQQSEGPVNSLKWTDLKLNRNFSSIDISDEDFICAEDLL
ncbi:MAG: xanthine dehydrogenase accessory protein XdhC [Acidiferrobacterales bacterium]|nr:xanthine dehydrogenase accessory protein XdhC [Acidiferrobacterales bacterium]